MTARPLYLALFSVLYLFSCKQHPAEHKNINHVLAKKSVSQSDLPREFAEHISTKETHVLKDSLKNIELLIANREQKISRFPCSDCHNPDKQLSQLENPHKEIILNHGNNGKVTSCQNCHGEKTNKASLYSLEGENISYNHVYELCGQCHYKAQRDWVGGSHGKRLSGWGEKRVQQNCTGCHNPHSPLMPHKWPVIQPQSHEVAHD